jgi:hypothetical protein
MLIMNNTIKDSTLNKLIGELEQNRDELKLKAHLFKEETKDEWLALEKKWHHFKGSARHLGYQAKVASGDISAATQLLGEEIKTGYKRIIKSL